MQSLKRWLNTKEFEMEFGISITSQQKMRNEKSIPFSRVGLKRIWYDRLLIDEWLESKNVTD